MLGTSYGCPQLFIRMLNKIMQGITHNSKTNKDTLVRFLHSLVWVNKTQRTKETKTNKVLCIG